MSTKVVFTPVYQPYNPGCGETNKRKTPPSPAAHEEKTSSNQQPTLDPLSKRHKVEPTNPPSPQVERINFLAFERFNDLKNASSLVLMDGNGKVFAFEGTDLIHCPQYLRDEFNFFGIYINRAGIEDYSSEVRNRKWITIRPPEENAPKWHKEDFKTACIDLAMGRFDPQTHFWLIPKTQ